MKNKTTLLIIAAVIIIAVLAIYFFVFRKTNPSNYAPVAEATPTATASSATSGGKVVCSDGPCIATNFFSCTPAELTMTDPNSTTSITISVFGTENEKCHYQMNADGHGLDCFFAKESLNENLLNQMFGNEVGQAQVVTDSCKQF
ncbi:MAG: hypothetical protein Q8N90_03065 [bacterium]|nr:hypothetical protein [bacterium]